jgi:hypothetical protein
MDYTNYWDGQVTNKVPILEDYNSFNFKHATSKYRSNVDYTKAVGNFNKIEYGQEKYTVPGTKDVKEYKTETKFSVIPGVQLPGTKLITYYGFTSDTPDFTSANEARYKPNYGELTLFYEWDPDGINGNPILTEDYSIACQSADNLGQPTVQKLNNVVQFMPFTMNGNSLLFNALQSTIYNVIGKPSTGYPDYNNLTQSLYKRYYEDQTARFLDPNVYISSVKMDLDLEELYLTDGTVSDPRPYGFRLQNDIILDNQRYKIEEANIDYTTGKSTFKISNYNNIVVKVPKPDVVAPSQPTGLISSQISSSSSRVSWTASTDNVGVVAYNVYLNGIPAGTTEDTTFLFEYTPSAYVATIIARDAAGNLSPPASIHVQ